MAVSSVRSRALVLMTVVPLAVAAATVVALLVAAPQLPSKLALHWDFNGVDRVGGIGEMVAMVAIMVPIVTAILLVTFVLLSRGKRESTFFARVFVGLSTFIAFLMALLSISLPLLQRGADNVREIPASAAAPWIVGSLVLAAAIGLAFTRLIPALPVDEGDAAGSEPLPLKAGEVAYWTQLVSPHPAVLLIPILAGVVLTVTLLFFGAPWGAALAVDAALAFVAGTMVWRVVIDSRGIRFRSLLGIPRFAVPIADVVAAKKVTVEPMKEFGGWGVRVAADGRWGVVVRKGQAIEILRHGKSPLLVTVDDAASGAGLLTSLARRVVERGRP